ncbi:MAG: hypothetical protein SFY96_00210 [Planctomycetota bacterium]|nr:hypothetical protein [Planctomycetota bacterium]
MLTGFPIALSLAGLERAPAAPWAAGPRAAIEWAASLGARHIVLDATAAGLRARELDRSARRDLAAMLRRLGLSFAGLDAWVPTTHFADPVHAERALDAVDGAIGLCAELSDLSGATGRVVSVAFPENLTNAAAQRIAAVAERSGVRVADHAIPRGAASERHAPIIGAGVDPAAILSAGQDPAAFVAALRAAPACARLSDLSAAGRVVPGTRGGRLMLDAYLASLSVVGLPGPLVADLRHIRDQASAAPALLRVSQA